MFDYTANGTWSAGGTKTLTEVGTGQLFVVVPQGMGTPMLGVALNTSSGFALRASGGYATGSHTSYMATFTIDGSEWELVAASYIAHTASGNHGAATSISIGRIIRLL